MTATGANGEFIVDVPEGTQLRATYVGYKPTVFTATDTPTAKVLMEWNSEELPEVEIVAYRRRRGGWGVIIAVLAAIGIAEEAS